MIRKSLIVYLVSGALYKNEKSDRINQRIENAIGMTCLSIEEFREILKDVGYSKFDVFEEKKKGPPLNTIFKRAIWAGIKKVFSVVIYDRLVYTW